MNSLDEVYPSVEGQGFETAAVSSPRRLGYTQRNGSIERVDSAKYLFAFGKHPQQWYRSYVLVLDEHCKAIEPASELPLPFDGTGPEDTRLIWRDGTVYCAYTDVTLESECARLNFKQALCVLDSDLRFLKRIPLNYGGNVTGRWEKNWSFFFWENRLHFIYSIEKHIVVEIDEEGVLRNEYRTNRKLPRIYDDFNLHSGTPPKRLDHDRFITFFHSWNRTDSWACADRLYRVSAYVFEARPPFRILQMTKPLIFGSSANTPGVEMTVLFPAGLVVENDHFLVSVGMNDMSTKLIKIGRKLVFDSLVPF